MKKTFINFNDESIPIGKRKQAYARWAISKGTPEIQAKRQANDKFEFEKKEKVFFVISDNGRVHQNSFNGVTDELWQNHINVEKYKDWGYVIIEDGLYKGEDSIERNEKEIKKLINQKEKQGYKVKYLQCIG